MPQASTILVVDDEATLQRLIARVLGRAGFESVAVGDGDAAAAALEKEPDRFGAVVLDGTVPPGGGAEALRALLARKPDLGVVLTSGAELDPPLRALLREYAGVFLAKPFSPDALVDAVRQALGGR